MCRSIARSVDKLLVVANNGFHGAKVFLYIHGGLCLPKLYFWIIKLLIVSDGQCLNKSIISSEKVNILNKYVEYGTNKSPFD